MLISFGVADSVISKNDISIGTGKVVGCVQEEFTSGIVLMRGLMSFSLDKTLLQSAFKDAAKWQRISSVDSASGIKLNRDMISTQCIKSFKTIFGKDLTIDNLTDVEKRCFMEVQ